MRWVPSTIRKARLEVCLSCFVGGIRAISGVRVKQEKASVGRWLGMRREVQVLARGPQFDLPFQSFGPLSGENNQLSDWVPNSHMPHVVRRVEGK
jgi:hypothetical protein